MGITVLPEWSKQMRRLGIKKKQLKISARYFEMNLNQFFFHCDEYVKKHKCKDVQRMKIVFSGNDMMGKMVHSPVQWGAIYMVCMYNAAANGLKEKDAQYTFEAQVVQVQAEGRINSYGLDLRQGAMALYYRGAGAKEDEEDGHSKLLHPNEALQLARHYSSFILTGISIRDFVEGTLTLVSPMYIKEYTEQQEIDYRAIVKWIAQTFTPTRLLTIEQGSDFHKLMVIFSKRDENRRKCVWAIVYYLIGFNDFEGNIIEVAGEIFDKEWLENTYNSYY